MAVWGYPELGLVLEILGLGPTLYRIFHRSPMNKTPSRTGVIWRCDPMEM